MRPGQQDRARHREHRQDCGKILAGPIGPLGFRRHRLNPPRSRKHQGRQTAASRLGQRMDGPQSLEDLQDLLARRIVVPGAVAAEHSNNSSIATRFPARRNRPRPDRSGLVVVRVVGHGAAQFGSGPTLAAVCTSSSAERAAAKSSCWASSAGSAQTRLGVGDIARRQQRADQSAQRRVLLVPRPKSAETDRAPHPSGRPPALDWPQPPRRRWIPDRPGPPSISGKAAQLAFGSAPVKASNGRPPLNA